MQQQFHICYSNFENIHILGKQYMISAKLHYFIRSSPRQCPNRLTEVGCVRPSIRSQSFSDLALMWRVGMNTH